MSKVYNCINCDREFKTKSGLWKHNIKHNTKNTTEKKVYNCRYCNRNFNIKQSRWAHEQKCRQINKIPLDEQVKKLTEEIKIIKLRPNTISSINLIDNYIYLLQEREFIKTNEPIYKIGMSQCANLQRFSQYPKGSKLLYQTICNDCKSTEQTIINNFKKQFVHRT